MQKSMFLPIISLAAMIVACYSTSLMKNIPAPATCPVCDCPSVTVPPTYTPLPTYTPVNIPSCSFDLAQDTSLAELINSFREQNGQSRLFLSYHLAYIATNRVQLTMIPGIDLGAAQIDPRTMPQNYVWLEYTFGGDSDFALSINTPQAVLQDLIERRSATGDLLDHNGVILEHQCYATG